jgi:hypothetical protein
MATFQFSALDATGKEKRGTIEAQTQQEAFIAIQRYGLQPTNVFAVNQAPAAYAPPPHALTHAGPPRSSGAVIFSIVLSLLAILAALGSLCWHFLTPDPLGKGMKAYDFSSAKATYTSEMKAQLHSDFRAMLEYREKLDGPRVREQLNSLKVEEVAWKEYAILFISYKEKDEEKKRLVMYKKDDKSNLWQRSYVSSFDVRKENAELADRMDKWEGKGMDKK